MLNLIIYIILLFVEAFVVLTGIVWWLKPPPSGNPYAGPILTLGGMLFLAWTLVRIVRMNRLVQQENLERAQEGNGQVLLRWKSGAGEAVLCHDALFTDGREHRFNSWYEKLAGIHWSEGGERITFTIISNLGGAKREIGLAVPPELQMELHKAVQHLHERHRI